MNGCVINSFDGSKKCQRSHLSENLTISSRYWIRQSEKWSKNVFEYTFCSHVSHRSSIRLLSQIENIEILYISIDSSRFIYVSLLFFFKRKIHIFVLQKESKTARAKISGERNLNPKPKQLAFIGVSPCIYVNRTHRFTQHRTLTTWSHMLTHNRMPFHIRTYILFVETKPSVNNFSAM